VECQNVSHVIDLNRHVVSFLIHVECAVIVETFIVTLGQFFDDSHQF